MDLSIVFPMFWGREKKQVVQDGDYFYDHPTPLDDEGTIPPLFESLKVLKDQEFDIIAIAGANHPSMAEAVEKRAGEVLGAKLEGAANCDVVIDCAGTDQSMLKAVNLCKPGGTILLLASYWGGLNLPAGEIMTKEIRILSSMAQARQGLVRDVDIAAAALAKNPNIAKVLITHRMPIDAAVEAFSIAGNRAAGAIKVTLNP